MIFTILATRFYIFLEPLYIPIRLYQWTISPDFEGLQSRSANDKPVEFHPSDLGYQPRIQQFAQVCV